MADFSAVEARRTLHRIRKLNLGRIGLADLQVLRTQQATDGDILAICGNWNPPQVSKATAIAEIMSCANRFYAVHGTNSVWVRVVNGPTGEYLRTDADSTTRNNLLDLPDC